MLASLTCSCRKDLTFDAVEKAADAISEQGPSGLSTWIVRPDGSVSATLKTADGKPIDEPVTGQITFAAASAPSTTIPAQYDPKTHVLTAQGPKLADDLTPVHYALVVGGNPWDGSIDVPQGGTKELVDTGKLQASISPGAVGPHGGLVQVVGPDRVELAANKVTGEVRAYVLDSDGHPVDPGDRKITLAIQAEKPELVVLEPQPHTLYLASNLRTRVDPTHVTIAVTAKGVTHACLAGWSPGSVVFLGPHAPRVRLLAVEEWSGPVVELHGHGKHEGHVLAGASGVLVEEPSLVVEAPAVVVGAPEVEVRGGATVHAGAHGHAEGQER
jgi:hypothetical protein